MNIPCDTIRDLLPLYHDEVCSQESRKLVEEHLAGCESCRAELAKTGEGMEIFLPEESFRRVGQAAAAAMLEAAVE